MGGTPNEDWGKHAGAPVPDGVDFADECSTCRAVQWLDAAQAEMRRREKPRTLTVPALPGAGDGSVRRRILSG